MKTVTMSWWLLALVLTGPSLANPTVSVLDIEGDLGETVSISHQIRK